MSEVMQRAFAAGEISPSMAARADMVPYGTGLRRARNVIGAIEGGMMNRPGTEFIRPMKVLGTKSHPFIFNESQAYHLEFGYDPTYSGGATTPGSGYIRFTYRGSTLVLPAGVSTGVIAWAANGTYAIRDLVSSGTRHYYCTVAHTDVASNKAPGTAGGEPYWYRLSVDPDVTNGSIYEIPTPYLAADVRFTYRAQSADVMIVACRRVATISDPTSGSYAPRLLRRFGHISWDFLPAPFKPDSTSPNGIAASVPSVGTYTYRYQITARDKDSDQESLPGYVSTGGFPATGTITAAGSGNVKINAVAHALGAIAQVYIVSISATPLDPTLKAALLDMVFYITADGADNFFLNDTAGLTLPAATHTVTWSRAKVSDTGIARDEVGGPTATAPNVVTWTAVPNANQYSIYGEESDGTGTYGFLGISVFPTFNDVGVTPDMSETPPQTTPKFLLNGNHPAVCSFFDQRLVLANSELEPQVIYLSRAGDLFNFTKRSPLQEDDSIKAPLAAKQVNGVQHVVELGEGALVLTGGGEGLLLGDSDNAVSPKTIRHKPQGYHGSNNVPPLEIADRILYALARGNKILEIRRGDFGGYEQGIDPALFAQHLFGAACGCSLVAMAWAERPDNVVWVIRSDGLVLGMTFVANQNVRCWTRHDTRGVVQHLFKDVVVVPEGSVDTPYFTVNRTINGVEMEYLEAMTTRCGACDE